MLEKEKRVYYKIQLKNKQRVVKREFEKNCLTDDVLDKQLEINKLRNKYDLHDETEEVYEEFVQ